MTEEQARQKWCPMYHGWVSDTEVKADESRYFKCKGWSCMMWRWEFADGGQHPCEKSTTEGYCGLAGKP